MAHMMFVCFCFNPWKTLTFPLSPQSRTFPWKNTAFHLGKARLDEKRAASFRSEGKDLKVDVKMCENLRLWR